VEKIGIGGVIYTKEEAIKISSIPSPLGAVQAGGEDDFCKRFD